MLKRLLPFYIQYYPNGCGWKLIKWKYLSKTSWLHGTAYLGKIKIYW